LATLSGCAAFSRETEVVMPAPRAIEREPARPANPPDQRLTEQVTRLAAELSELQNAVARLVAASRDQEGQLQALHRRVSELAAHSRDGLGSAPRGLAPAPRSLTPSGEAPIAGGATPTVATPEDLYRSGLTKSRAGDLDGAVLIFYELIANHPTHQLRESAQFLVGDIFYAQKDLRGALAEFEGLLDAVPTGAKVPDVLLKVGLCQRGLGDEAAAQTTWERVIREFPRSAAARQARVLLRGRGAG
jgi:tol-pal system protein YbgF